jgi:hypothetical protein
VPGGKLPITQARILRNRINNYSGPGISVSGGVLISSIVGNSIMFVTQTGISVTGPSVASEVIVRDNEVFNVVPPAAAAATQVAYGPQTSGTSLGQEASLSFEDVQAAVAIPVTGIQVAGTTTATIENNSVALIGNSGGGSRAIGIEASNSAMATISGNDISDIGPPTTREAAGAAVGVYADSVATANVSNNVIRQTTSGSTERMPFSGILIDETADSIEKLTGEALISGNMVYGNFPDLVAARAGQCVLSANVCKQAAQLPGNDVVAVVTVVALTCIASNNRILSAGQLGGLSITVPNNNKDLLSATVVGNIVSTWIHLNGNPLPAPWHPLNVIA